VKRLFSSLFAFLKPVSVDSAGPDPQAASTMAAKEWLLLMDRGEYRTGWQEAAPSLKAAEPCDPWTDSVATRHGKAGKVIVREVTGFRLRPARSEDALHTAVVDFRSQYEGGLMKERVTLEHVGGAWRTAAYSLG
jgi:hypothetical protein